MYETEANNKTDVWDKIPTEVAGKLNESRANVVSRTVLPWSEHCTECVWPTCYSTCDQYSAREDGRCRRFVDGMVRVEAPTALLPYLLKIRFKRWGKLWTPGNLRLYPAAKAQRLERRDYLIGAALVQFPLPFQLRKTITGKRYSFKKRMATRVEHSDQWPTCFLIECYNPESRQIQLSLTMHAADADKKIPFQCLIELTPGFQRLRIPIDQIASVLDVRAPFSIDLIPNGDVSETTLYFGLMEFVQEAAQPANKTKCVVWDLDNTLWDGILVEDGRDKLTLKEGIVEIIHTLDSRGILQSIASKNNRQEALQALKRFGLDQYFVSPQISWQPKSESVRAVARQLNIGMDTLLFVDDTPFELEEVKRSCPEVRTLDARLYQGLASMPELDVPVTQESRSRRAMYQLETERQKIAEGFGNDYMAFLKHCQIELSIQSLSEDNLDRVHELTQRTNQMNFSGNRYDRDKLRTILNTPHLDTYVVSCRDRFGNYGIIGFGIVDKQIPRITDLMFSCRVQSKRVEHAVLSYILRKYVAESGKDVYTSYRKTPRNEPSGRVFADFGMAEVGIYDGVSDMSFHQDQPVPDDYVIRLIHEDTLAAV